jgi:hypothetical protein
VSYWKAWAALNWVPIVIGALILIGLIVLLSFWLDLQRVKSTVIEEPEPLESSETVEPGQMKPAEDVAAVPTTAASAAGAGAAPQANVTTTTPSNDDTGEGADPDREVFEL